MARLFFALWPDGGAGSALAAHAQRLARSAGGRAVPAANVHLTLVFLGEVEPSRIDAILRAAGEVRSSRFRVAPDEIGSFRRSAVAWAGFRQPPAELLALQANLAEKLALQGFEREARAFAPHLTLVRRIASPVAREAIEPVPWKAEAISLVETNRARGGYATLAEWPMRERQDQRPADG